VLEKKAEASINAKSKAPNQNVESDSNQITLGFKYNILYRKSVSIECLNLCVVLESAQARVDGLIAELFFNSQ
jgi:hypothetical protein